MDFATFCIDTLARLRQAAPLVHNITNYVVMNSSANILLAAGASPVMAHCGDEVEEMATHASALVLNIGTLQEDWILSMIRAARVASARGIPIVLDPVGAGATRLRTEAVKRIMGESAITVLRGNASEIFSLRSSDIRTRGVDSSLTFTDAMVELARDIAQDFRCVVAISGEVDCITDGQQVFRVSNGHPLMTRVTGAGCGLSAITGAFCAAAPADPVLATAAAFGYYGVCGERAARISPLPGSFAVAFLDQLYAVGADELALSLKVSRI